MIGKVCIKNLRTQFKVGITEEEQEVPQNLYFDIDCFVDLGRCVETDDLADTVDYKDLDHAISNLAQNSRFRMIETVAHAVADVCLLDAHVLKVVVQLAKRHRSIVCDSVGVEITKQKTNYAY